MGDFKINEKTVFTQSGSAEPAMGSTVTGIPAAGVTGVLPVAVTGGSGLTALGTVTAGNLSNTAIVYPAGHIIQVQYVQLLNTWSLAASGASLAAFDNAYIIAGDSDLPSASITTRQANSKILVLFFIGNTHAQSGNPYVNFHIERMKDGSAEALISTGALYGLNRSGGGDERGISTVITDSPADVAGTVLKYRSVWYSSGGTAGIGSSGTTSQMTLMDIAV